MHLVKDVFYSLKMRYGLPIDIYTITAATTSDAGITTRTTTKQAVKRAVVTQSKNGQKAIYDMALLLKEGGYFDTSERNFLIDRSDAVVSVGQYIIHNNRKYEVKDVEELESIAAYSARGREVPNDTFSQIYNFKVYQFIGTSQGVT